MFPVGAEPYDVDRVFEPFDPVLLHAKQSIPDADGLVSPATSEKTAVCAEGRGVHVALLVGTCEYFGPGRHIENFHHSAYRSGKPAAVWAEGNADNRSGL